MKPSVKRIVQFASLYLAAVLAVTLLAQSSVNPPSNGTVASVAGTTWVGPDTHGRHYTYEFLPDGTLRYTYETGSFSDATWKQDGDSIYMSINNKFSERQGRITGNHMEGDAWNVKGEKWTWQADKR